MVPWFLVLCSSYAYDRQCRVRTENDYCWPLSQHMSKSLSPFQASILFQQKQSLLPCIQADWVSRTTPFLPVLSRTNIHSTFCSMSLSQILDARNTSGDFTVSSCNHGLMQAQKVPNWWNALVFGFGPEGRFYAMLTSVLLANDNTSLSNAYRHKLAYWQYIL